MCGSKNPHKTPNDTRESRSWSKMPRIMEGRTIAVTMLPGTASPKAVPIEFSVSILRNQISLSRRQINTGQVNAKPIPGNIIEVTHTPIPIGANAPIAVSGRLVLLCILALSFGFQSQTRQFIQYIVAHGAILFRAGWVGRWAMTRICSMARSAENSEAGASDDTGRGGGI